LRKAGVVRSPVDGLPISVKDLYDVAGDVTRAGSKLLAGAPPAAADAPAIARLRAAGAVIVGRTNMVEFAFGTSGLNPHYGTPKSPWDRATGRVPGGSSSGAAVAVADGMCVMGLGSDTRGSIRVPAAFCGISGWKPTQRRVPREGAFPLSTTLDTVGPLANTLACCAAYDAVLADAPLGPLPAQTVKGLRLLLPKSALLEELDADVSRAFAAALHKLGAAGAVITERAVPEFDRQAEYFRLGGYAGAEAYALHRRWHDRRGEYDPRIAKRIDLAAQLSAADYVELGLMRAAYIRAVEAISAPFDAILMPTVPCVPPPIAEVDASDEAYFAANARFLKNVGVLNFLDGCGASLPCHEPGGGPVGLTVFGPAMSDRRTLAAALAIERLLRRLD
jgi:aspartyl-tRNA(Asn)/glutamyl-tRNA(Gln) amidotransferase subunit A